MPRAKYIHGMVVPWERVLGFLDTLAPWQALLERAAERAGKPDEEFRRIAAVAVGTCLVSHRLPESLVQVLEMIARHKSQPFRWHGQISPERWREINTYIVAMHGWLTDRSAQDAAGTFLLPVETVAETYDYIGTDRSPVKTAMVKRLLYQIVRLLVTSTNLSIIGDERQVLARDLRYQDFSRTWEMDGLKYQTLDPTDKPVRDLNETIRQSGAPGDAFLSYLERQSTPVCHLQARRYQEVALYRIGKEWTEPESFPPQAIQSAQLRREFEMYASALARWQDGRSAPDEHLRRFDTVVQETLGKPDERKHALVDCFFFRSGLATDLQEAAYHWLQTNGHVPVLEAAG